MPRFLLDFIAARQVKRSLILDLSKVRRRDCAALHMGFNNSKFHFLPAAVFGFAAPNRGHCRGGVTVDHEPSGYLAAFLSKLSPCTPTKCHLARRSTSSRSTQVNTTSSPRRSPLPRRTPS